MRLIFVNFLDRYFYDLDHLFRYMQANNIGFRGEGMFAELDYTREEFTKVFNKRRILLPNKEKLKWEKLSRKEAKRLAMLSRTNWGYQRISPTLQLKDPVFDQLLKLGENRYIWYLPGANWGWNVIAIFSGAGMIKWLDSSWKLDYRIKYGIDGEALYDKLYDKVIMRSSQGLLFASLEVKYK